MRIIETYDVWLTGSGNYQSHSETPFKIEDDNQSVFEIHLPNYPLIVEGFRWLDDHDSLRHLLALTPDYHDNRKEIEKVIDRNTVKEENAYLTGSVGYRIDPVTFTKERCVFDLEPIPPLLWKARWVFRSRSHAVAFKLAMKV